MAIGDIFIRQAGDGPKQIKITGIANNNWIAQNLEKFDTPFEISAGDLAAFYGGSGTAVPIVDEIRVWGSFKQNWLDQSLNAAAKLNRELRSQPSPEEIFRAQAAETSKPKRRK